MRWILLLFVATHSHARSKFIHGRTFIIWLLCSHPFDLLLRSFGCSCHRNRFSRVNLSSINSRSFTDRSRVLKTNLSLTMSSTADYSRDFTLFFNRATNLSTILVFLHYLPKLMSLKDHVLPRVAVPLKLLNGLIHLLLIAFRKLKCGENRKN